MHTTAPNTPAQDTHHISYFLADPETPNRHYTTERLLRKRNPQRLHQQMEGTNQRILQNSIKARKEKGHTA